LILFFIALCENLPFQNLGKKKEFLPLPPFPSPTALIGNVLNFNNE